MKNILLIILFFNLFFVVVSAQKKQSVDKQKFDILNKKYDSLVKIISTTDSVGMLKEKVSLQAQIIQKQNALEMLSNEVDSLKKDTAQLKSKITVLLNERSSNVNNEKNTNNYEDCKNILLQGIRNELDNFYQSADDSKDNLYDLRDRFKKIDKYATPEIKKNIYDTINRISKYCVVMSYCKSVLSKAFDLHETNAIIESLNQFEAKNMDTLSSLQKNEISRYKKLLQDYNKISCEIRNSILQFYQDEILAKTLNIEVKSIAFTINENVGKTSYPFLYKELILLKDAVIKNNLNDCKTIYNNFMKIKCD